MILGGTRFIGVALTEELLAAGHEPLLVHRGKTERDDQPDVPHLHVDRHDLGGLTSVLSKSNADAFIDTGAYSGRDAGAALAALSHDVPAVTLSSQDVYRAFHSLLNGDPGLDPVPLNETSPLRSATQRYLFRGRPPIPGSAEDNEAYENLDVEEAYLARGATVLRLPMVYGERDLVRREEFILRRVRAGRRQIPIGSGTLLWSRGYVRDIAVAIRLATETNAAAGSALNVSERRTWTMAEWSRQILAAAGSDAELARVPDETLPGDMELTASVAQHLLVSSEAARRILGWEDSDPIECVHRSVEWHLRHPPSGERGDFGEDDVALRAGKGRKNVPR